MPHGGTPHDASDFSPKALPQLAAAGDDLRLLLGRGYAMGESLELVGNHFRLTKRQRLFLFRGVSPPRTATARRAKLRATNGLAGENLIVDGYNCLITTECCLAGGIVLMTDDGVLRDIGGLHGAYAISAHTPQAVARLCAVIAAGRPARCTICLDARMRHARRTAELWAQELESLRTPHHIATVPSANAFLREQAAGAVLATGDRRTIDAAASVVDLPGAVASQTPEVRVIALPEPIPGETSARCAEPGRREG